MLTMSDGRFLVDLLFPNGVWVALVNEAGQLLGSERVFFELFRFPFEIPVTEDGDVYRVVFFHAKDATEPRGYIDVGPYPTGEVEKIRIV